jgi:hypothetical protein
MSVAKLCLDDYGTAFVGCRSGETERPWLENTLLYAWTSRPCFDRIFLSENRDKNSCHSGFLMDGSKQCVLHPLSLELQQSHKFSAAQPVRPPGTSSWVLVSYRRCTDWTSAAAVSAVPVLLPVLLVCLLQIAPWRLTCIHHQPAE